MSDDGDRMCPLCAEDMDLTDQQLKPCKCGYEICVWCWHQIMDMAEKEQSEGRCPACRTPYDKERIVGMAANCERLVAEVNAEKRQKSQKSKPKTSPEARKHLNSVRVVQRNLVYVIGLPCNLSDETLLERKEYFGQYGKVLKVSIARSTSAAQQISNNNNTFNVYITYATEEEAIRCIQAVHTFVLEGKTLRACFGTTKYCHTWLRNMTCTNPDCLYLHDIGTQEDSFTKDEIISAYTRSSVSQIASNNLQRRSGSVLPLPAGNVCNGGTATSKHTHKGAASNCTSQMKASLPTNSFVGKPAGLPVAASWGMRRQPTVTAASSQGPPKQKTETKNGLSFMPPVISSTRNNCTWHNDHVTSDLPDGRTLASSASKSRGSENLSEGIGSDYMSLSGTSSSVLDAFDASVVVSAWDDDDDDDDDTSAKVHEEKQVNVHVASLEPVEYSESRFIVNCQNPGSDESSEIIVDATHDSITLAGSSNSISSPKDRDGGITIVGSNKNLVNTVDESLNRWFSNSVDGSKVIDRHTTSNGGRDDTNLGLPTLTRDDYIDVEQSKMNQHQTSVLSHFPVGTSINDSSSLEPIPREHHNEPTASLFSEDAVFDANITRESHDISSVSRLVMKYVQKQPEDVGQSDGASAVTNQPSYIHQTPDIVNNSFSGSWGNEYKSVDPIGNGVTLSITTDGKKDFGGRENESFFCNGHAQDKLDGSKQIKEPDLICVSDKVKDLDISAHADMDMHESSIILNALSLDFDPWNDSFPATSGFVSLLRVTDKQEGPFKSSNSWKSPQCSESRFSFARQENQANNVEPPLADNGHDHRFFSSSPYGYEGSVSNRFAVPVSLASHDSAVPSDRIVGGSRAKISAPPGFSVPGKAPPPGFSSQDRFVQTIDVSYAENQPQQSVLLHQNLSHSIENTGDVEFYDPAILAVGKGRLPLGASNSGLGLPFSYPMQTSTSEFDPRLQWLMQQSMTAQQDLRIQDHLMDRFLHPNDSCMYSGILADNSCGQSPAAQMSFLQPQYPHVVHGQWDHWNGTQAAGNGVGMGDMLRSERYGIHGYFPVNEDHKFYIPGSADTFNRSFGM